MSYTKIVSNSLAEFNNISKVNEENNRKIELVFLPDFEQEILDLIKTWEKKNDLWTIRE